MQFLFRIELDKGPKSPHDPACLEITRIANDITFTIMDGNNKSILVGDCDSQELFRMAAILAEGEE